MNDHRELHYNTQPAFDMYDQVEEYPKEFKEALDGYALEALTKRQRTLYKYICMGYEVGTEDMDIQMGYLDKCTVYRMHKRMIKRLREAYERNKNR